MMHPYLIPDLITIAAKRTPDAVAFRCDEIPITYAEFDRRTNQLANMLVEQGVERRDRVAIYLHKSMESVIALYGIMKAGAVYVPLDPSLPAGRIEFVLRDCHVRHVISQQSKLPLLIELAASVELECVIGVEASAADTSLRLIPWSEVAKLEADSAPSLQGVLEDDLAYIMYTSGSTGKPKGLMHTHRSGLSYAKITAATYGVTSDDILSNHSPLHYDMSTFDFFAGPLCGATTIIIPEEYMMLPASLSELIQDEKITIWYSVTTAVVELLVRGDLDNRDFSSLRWIKFGGETFPPRHLRNMMARLPHTRFSNVYGPAEVNQCTYFHVPPLPNKYADRYVPIGHTWAGTDYLVMDQDDQEVIDGEVGELLIASSTRMQGYWNRPDLTEAGFYRQRPYPNAAVEKVYYRTGDLVRKDEDGALMFLGRKDRQIKLRGFRIELDEIEIAFTSHPAVAEAAVYLMDSDKDEPFIEVALLMDQAVAALPDNNTILQHAASHIPNHSIPARLVVRESFPRTGSGKIDRRALQDISHVERLQST